MINICGTMYHLEECKDHFDANDLHMGQIEYGDTVIRINADMSEEAKIATICHEIVHGILMGIGREDLSQDEQFVTALGNAINGAFMIKD